MTDIDWASLQKEANDLVIADGDYNAQVIKSEATTSSNGKPMIKLQLAIIDGPKKDRKIFTQLTLTADNPFAIKKWFDNLAALGLGPDFFGGNPKLDDVAAALMNRGCTITLGTGEWQGTTRNQVDQIKPYGGSGPTPPGMVLGAPAAGPRSPAASPSPTAGPTPPTPASPTPAASPVAATPGTPPPARPF